MKAVVRGRGLTQKSSAPPSLTTKAVAHGSAHQPPLPSSLKRSAAASSIKKESVRSVATFDAFTDDGEFVWEGTVKLKLKAVCHYFYDTVVLTAYVYMWSSR